MSEETQTPVTQGRNIALYTAVGTVVIGAMVTMWAIIADPPGDTVGKAIFTLLLLTAFSFAAIGETSVNRASSALTSARMTVHAVVAVAGLFLIWNQIDPAPFGDFEDDIAAFIGILFLLEGIGANLMLGWDSWQKRIANEGARMTFNAGMGMTLAVLTAISLPLTFVGTEFPELYWRTVLAFAVLALVLLVLPVLITAILKPRKPAARKEVVHQTYNPMMQAQQQGAVSAPAGWYDVPGTGFERYWDGSNWTEMLRDPKSPQS